MRVMTLQVGHLSNMLGFDAWDLGGGCFFSAWGGWSDLDGAAAALEDGVLPINRYNKVSRLQTVLTLKKMELL